MNWGSAERYPLYCVYLIPPAGSVAKGSVRPLRNQKCRGTEHVHRPGGGGVLRRYACSGKQNGKPELPIPRIPQGGESRGFIETNIHKRWRGRSGSNSKTRKALYPGRHVWIACRAVPRWRKRAS